MIDSSILIAYYQIYISLLNRFYYKNALLQLKCLINKFNIITNLCMLLFMYPAIVPGSSREELMVMTVTEIVNQLIQAHQQGKDVNLNR